MMVTVLGGALFGVAAVPLKLVRVLVILLLCSLIWSPKP